MIFWYYTAHFPFIPQSNFLNFIGLLNYIIIKEVVLYFFIVMFNGYIFSFFIWLLLRIIIRFLLSINKLRRIEKKFEIGVVDPFAARQTAIMLFSLVLFLMYNAQEYISMVMKPITYSGSLMLGIAMLYRISHFKLKTRNKPIFNIYFMLFTLAPLYLIIMSKDFYDMLLQELKRDSIIIENPSTQPIKDVKHYKARYKMQYGSEFMLLYPKESIIYLCVGEGERNCTLYSHHFRNQLY